MSIKPIAFFRACDPDKALDIRQDQDRKYYTDFSPVREGQVIEKIRDDIEWSKGKPTCHLFTGHMGCGKSTELLRLGYLLEKEKFEVVSFQADNYLDMGDIDVTDILIVIARQISEHLDVKLKSKSVIKGVLDGVGSILKETGITIPGADALGINFFKIFGDILEKTKNSPDLRNRLRQCLEPQTTSILNAINQELLEPVHDTLKQNDKNGLVVILDGLDRIERSAKPGGKTQPEYLFTVRGEQLNKLNCHVVYTVPFELIFSKDIGFITAKFDDYSVLPMIPVKARNGNEHEKGMALLRQMVLARAFPDEEPSPRDNRIREIFDSEETLNRLCRISGGHARNLLILLKRSIQKNRDLPISTNSLEQVIREWRNKSKLTVMGKDWNLLRQVRETQNLHEYEKYHQLLRNLFVLEYRDENGSWFDVDPIIGEAEELTH